VKKVSYYSYCFCEREAEGCLAQFLRLKTPTIALTKTAREPKPLRALVFILSRMKSKGEWMTSTGMS